MTNTTKLYYENPLELKAKAHVVKADGDLVVVDRTIFFPEGGGQVGSIGHLGQFEVIDTQKRGGRLVVQADLPMVNVETEVVHRVRSNGDFTLKPGDEVDLIVDESHRIGCMRHHGATHLIMCAIWELFGKTSFFTKGCLIGANEARLDLATEIKFDAQLIDEIRRSADHWVDCDAVVEMRPVPDTPEMFIWFSDVSQMTSMPCGGTHFEHLGPIGHVMVQRRSKGKNLERLYIKVS